ncbi:hypothetical protein DAKH74_023200 [Maudiozyma humilis]|uniref:AB hydrolase-1 domain-containing protein n=1 Tax=Maudiozyma humilis TaxID=51915 RepID=A0AAV5RVX2_MAUHU|nr:hypothetical protein DAKH74_023200 [Kazachstania humilis]
MLTHGINTYPMINPLHWGYNATVEHLASETGTVSLPLKDGKDHVDFSQFVSEYVPALGDGAQFQLDPRLFTGFLQTLYLSSADYSKTHPVFYGREIVQFDDGVCTADWVRNDWVRKYKLNEVTCNFDKGAFDADERKTHPEGWPRLQPRTRYMSESEKEDNMNDERPIVIIMHGLAGGSHEPIVRSLATYISQIDGGKFQVVVLNTRGCARSKITTPALFTGLHTGDLEKFALREKARFPKRNLYAMGLSFGAVMLANYLGRVGDKTPLKAALCLSGAWDMVLSSEKLQHDFWTRNLFSKNLTQFLVRFAKVNMGELEVPEGTTPETPPTVENPVFYTFTQSNMKKALQMRNVIEFDDVFIAPCLGFSSGIEYYKEASPLNLIDNISIPLIALNSKDDPVFGGIAIPQQFLNKNGNVLLCESDLGGHVAYLQSDGESWASKAIAQFFSEFDKNVL